MADLSNIDYNPLDGTFRWKDGSPAGCLYKNGYNMITVNRIRYRAARLAWYLSYGYWPREVDHINRIKRDDRLCNLREVTHSANMSNVATRAASGVKGIYRDRKKALWIVSQQREGIKHYIGCYTTFEKAREALQSFLRSRGEIQ